ncbi:MAG: TIGR04283 family arsenosugar biosynthesis glycosyltransferase [Betaproteobacteria bacterium]|nr:TIGR04283 family arsenosugar biosynthesis glycosyltransferase [Betaproteobacteria bacterium]
MPKLSLIVPTLNEEANIGAALEAAQPLRRRGVEILVVDGGSADRTTAIAASLSDAVIMAPRGRAAQMNAGAARARGDMLLFLHADTRLPPDADRLILEGLAASGRLWGRFDVAIASPHPLLRLTASLMNRRSRLTGIATGDQAIFVRRSAFHACGEYPNLPLMEDIAISSALKRLGRPLCLSQRVLTSARRWEKHGVVRTLFLMWRLRLAYFLGADPACLAERYGYPIKKS